MPNVDQRSAPIALSNMSGLQMPGDGRHLPQRPENPAEKSTYWHQLLGILHTDACYLLPVYQPDTLDIHAAAAATVVTGFQREVVLCRTLEDPLNPKP